MRSSIVQRRCACVSLGIALVGAPAAAWADGVAIAVSYEADPECPTRDAFLGGMRARTDRFDLTDTGAADRAYRVTLRSGNPATGRVETAAPDGSWVPRELSGRSCAEVADALELVVTLDLDVQTPPSPLPPLTQTQVPVTPPVTRPPPGPPVIAVESRVLRDAPARRRWPGELYTSVGMGANAGVTPNVLLGPEAFIEARLGPLTTHALAMALDARLGFSLGFSSVEGPGGDAARFTQTIGLLDLCPVHLASGRFDASACMRAEAGAVQSSGVGMQVSLQTTRPWLGAGALVLGRWEPVRPFFVQVEGGAVAGLVRDTFVFDDGQTPVYAVPAVGPVGAASVGARFW
jgi:hypothetical protein